jgi:hypothetical protein
LDHVYTVASYLKFCNGNFASESIEARDLSTRKKKGKEKMIQGDPLYVVRAKK